jgi:RNA polymerase sigma-70 factor (ECF subfamily)
MDAFITRKDQAAFEALMRRHGPMVLGVCRRILGNHHDAEDACQATFLVLARKAGSIRPRRLVANWLHGVACMTARKANAVNTRRRLREKQVSQLPEPAPVPQDPWLDMQLLLDHELRFLPDKHRLPIVLCDLQGLSISEATRQLGWPQGTVVGRLARGRKQLAGRLAGRGLVVPAGWLAGGWSPQAASACVPNSLVLSTAQFAGAMAAGQGLGATAIPEKVVALTEGVLKAMLVKKLKTLGMALVVVFVLLGTSAWAYQSLPPDDRVENQRPEAASPVAAGQSAPTGQPKTPLAKGQRKELKTDQQEIQGKWRLVQAERTGLTWVVNADGDLVCQDKTPRAFPIDLQVPRLVTFSRDKLIVEYPQGEDRKLVETSNFRLDVSKKPKWITDYRKGDKDVDGIYSLEQGTLRICWNYVWGQDRAGHPPGFDTENNRKAGMDTEVWVLHRDKK